MKRAFILVIFIFMIGATLSYSNVESENTSNSCEISPTDQQKINQYQNKISNSYEIAQDIQKSIPYVIAFALVIAILLITFRFYGNKQDILRFIYGTDNLAAITLTIFGSLIFLELLAAIALGGLPNSSDILPLMIHFMTYWKSWVFVIGVIGLLTRKERLSIERKNNGYQMPIWLILLGLIWIVEVATDALPSLLTWGTRYSVTFCTLPIPADSLPLSEIVDYFITEPSFIMIAVGVSLIFLKWIISVIKNLIKYINL